MDENPSCKNVGLCHNYVVVCTVAALDSSDDDFMDFLNITQESQQNK